MTKIFSSVIAAMLIMIGTGSASAQDQGFAICHMKSASQSKLFYSHPIAISKSAMSGIEARYVKMLRDKSYSNVGMYDPPNAAPPVLSGACSFHDSEAAATEALTAIRRGAARPGFNEFATSFDG